MDKKISFGFTKLNKKPNVIFKQVKEENKIELIECLEGQTIKIKDAVTEVYAPLVIPINDSKKNLLDRIKEAKLKQIKKEIKEEVDNRPDSELTIEELAARELIRDAKNRNNEKQAENKVLLLPEAVSNDNEPTLNDYENIPISDFGKAMLRGMGWKEEVATSVMAKDPELRPKGLGLGASKLIKTEKTKVVDEDGKKLILIRGAFAKIIAGSHKGNYCEVQGLDDEAGRVIVKTTLKSEILTLNEFLLVPVTKDEYNKNSRVLNSSSYEEYKNAEIGNSNKSDQRNKTNRHNDNIKNDFEKNIKSSNGKSKSRNDSSDSDEDSDKHRLRQKMRPESSDSDVDVNRRKNKSRDRSAKYSTEKKKHKSKSRHRSPSSETEYKKKKSKKNKCKSRHRRTTSSSESERDHKRHYSKYKR